MGDETGRALAGKVDMLNRWLVPVLVALTLFVGKTVVELKTEVSVLTARVATLSAGTGQTAQHEVRLVAIESNRYTNADARESEQRTTARFNELNDKIDRLSQRIPQSIPPEWFRLEVARIEAVVKELSISVRALERADHDHAERMTDED